jgi:cytosine/adenosine deaminase-related metal-dependent hydrolase
MFREMKNAVLQQRHNYWDARVTAKDALRSATVGGYRLLGLKGGKVAEGYVADLVLLDANELYPFSPERLVSHVVYYTTGDAVKKLIVSGKIIKKETLRREKSRLVNELNESLSSLSYK